MQKKIAKAGPLRGVVTLPGDKSISHRYAMISAIAEGKSTIRNYSTGADCHSTLGCVRALGIEVEGSGTEFAIHGKGMRGLQAPKTDLDAGNSGSTIRMLSGILAAQQFRSRIFGDESLSKRPMARIMKPLRSMGAKIEAREDKFPPLEIEGGPLRAIEYDLPVSSAQVKTCVLFAGMYADGETAVTGPTDSRDHTEIALREFGADITVARGRVSVKGGAKLEARELMVPSDLSSAAFFIAAALLVPGSQITIANVGLNPTRAALLDFLTGMGAKIRVPRVESSNGELIGDIEVSYSDLQGGTIDGGLTAGVIDEIPILSVLGAATEKGLTVRNAEELRIKETDRIATIVENLRRLGVEAEELPDGLIVPGRQTFRAGTFDSFGDHRIAMAFAVAGLRAEGESVIEEAEAASVSFPEFWDTLGALARG